MKDRSTNETANRSHSAANESAISQAKAKAGPAYQINDRRAASVMQRKFRNLANGLASANIIQPKAAPSFQSKTKPFNKGSGE